MRLKNLLKYAIPSIFIGLFAFGLANADNPNFWLPGANSTIQPLTGFHARLSNKANPDPTGQLGELYYNTTLGVFRCYTGSWVNCDTTGGSGTVSGGTKGYVVTWASSTALTTGILIDNGTVAGVNATSTGIDFYVKGQLQVTATSTLATTTATNLGMTQLLNCTNGVITGGSGVFACNGSPFLTGNQTITLSGDVTGSGATAITTAIGAGKVTNTMLAGSIAASKLIGTDIATVGTITTGTWNGSVIQPLYGGTGTSTVPTQQGQFLIADNTGAKYAPGTFVNTATFTWATGTPLQLQGNVVKVPNALTFNNGGAGAASGQTFDGSAAATISYNTIGAQPLLTNPDTGTGVSGQVAFWSGTTALSGDPAWLWDSTNHRFSINSSTPNATMTVQGSSTAPALDVLRAASSSGVTLLQVAGNGTTTLSSLGTGCVGAASGSLYIAAASCGASVSASGTAGSIQFAGAANAFNADQANFLWDNTNKKLGIGTSSPLAVLHVARDASSTLNSSLSTVASTTPVMLLGTTPVSSISANGTYFGLNAPSAFTGDMLNFQSNGSQVINVSAAAPTATNYRFSIASTTGLSLLTVNGYGSIRINSLIFASSTAPTVATSTGAGSASGTASVAGGNSIFTVTLNAGTSPAANAVIFKVTGFPEAAPNKIICNFSPANINAASSTANSILTYASSSPSEWDLVSGTSALTGSVSYIWDIKCGGR